MVSGYYQILPNIKININDPIIINNMMITIKNIVKYNIETYQIHIFDGEYEKIIAEFLSKEKAFIYVSQVIFKNLKVL